MSDATPGPWTVYRCQDAPDDRACGIHGPPDLNVPWQVNEGYSFVITDTNREECCHAIKLADAELIVRLKNESTELVDGFLAESAQVLTESELDEVMKVVDLLLQKRLVPRPQMVLSLARAAATLRNTERYFKMYNNVNRVCPTNGCKGRLEYIASDVREGERCATCGYWSFGR